MTDVPSPLRGTAGPEHTGRTCPYCRFPLKEGAAIVACGACGAAHHGDCWDDNRGCAVVACAGGPPAPGGVPAPGAAQHAGPAPAMAGHGTPPPPPTPTPAWSPPASGGSGGRNTLLVTAVLVLALAVAGAAVAFVATRKNAPASASTTVVTTVHEGAVPDTSTEVATTETTSETTTDPADTVDPAPVDSDTIPAGLTRSEMREDIRTLLLDHHQDLVDGDYQDAWDLMTARKQRQKERDPGYGQWVEDQKTLARYLDPSGIDVKVQSVDRATGVARVMVTGMAWSRPSASCSSWSGLTWVRWEQGAWRYDPGYSTTPQRTREWKHRFSELLGGSC
jgi:hypothetical protein